MNTILQTNALYKAYPMGKNEAQPILRDIDLQIKQGEFVAVMGASGSGKSTLLYNISGMDKTTGGTAQLLEQELTGLSEDALAVLRLNSIGYIFQQCKLLRNLNLFDNIAFPPTVPKKRAAG